MRWRLAEQERVKRSGSGAADLAVIVRGFQADVVMRVPGDAPHEATQRKNSSVAKSKTTR